MHELVCVWREFGIEERENDIERVKAIQQDALKEVGMMCIEYARQMRGAHVNTNSSVDAIIKLIAAKMPK